MTKEKTVKVKKVVEGTGASIEFEASETYYNRYLLDKPNYSVVEGKANKTADKPKEEKPAQEKPAQEKQKTEKPKTEKPESKD